MIMLTRPALAKAALARGVLAGLLATVATGAITATAVAEPMPAPTVSGLARFRSYPLIDRAYDALRRGDTARAGTLLEEALWVAPGDPDVLVQVLALYTRLERSEQVVALATEHLARNGAQDGGDAQVRAYRGFARRKLGQNREALEDFLAASARIPVWFCSNWGRGCFPPPFAPPRPRRSTKPCSTPPRASATSSWCCG
jgi:hypothetical protein